MAKLEHWILAIRAKTLPAGVMPVLVGSGLAYYQGFFSWYLFTLALICSVFLQLLSNFVNDLYDFKNGADTPERVGPQRQVAIGNIKYKEMKFLATALAVVTFLLGLLLVAHGGLPILIIGIVSLISAYAYTGGPYPLAYKGLGDIFVLIFFGWVAVTGTYYLHSLQFSFDAFLAGFIPGLLSMNILAVNNIRDIKTDKKANKLTIAVRMGRKKSELLYIVNNYLAYSIIALLAVRLDNYILVLAWFVMPFTMVLNKKITILEGTEMNPLLEDTGKQLALVAGLFSLSFVIASLF